MESFVVMPIVWALGFYYHRFDKRNADYERAMCFLPALIFYFSSWNSVSGTRYQSLLPYFHRSHSLTHTTVCNPCWNILFCSYALFCRCGYWLYAFCCMTIGCMDGGCSLLHRLLYNEKTITKVGSTSCPSLSIWT